MTVQVLMPQLGESVVEGTLTKWLKMPGERVEEYEPLVEINTDKVDTEIPSPAAGILLETRILEGAIVKAGTVLAVIDETGNGGNGVRSGEQAAPGLEEPNQHVAGESGTTAAPGGGGKSLAPPQKDHDLGFISPVVARIAHEQQIDLTQVAGTGQAGRITKRDILAYIEQSAQTSRPPARGNETAQTAPPIVPTRPDLPGQTPPVATYPQPAPVPTATEAQPQAAAEAQPVIPGGGDVLPLTPIRRAIAERMVYSKHTSPHVTTVMEVDLSRVVTHRERNKAGFAAGGANLTFTAYFVAAAVAGIQASPIVNSSWTEEGILLQRSIHIGMATSLGEAGLIVPVIRNADSLSLLGLAKAINDLVSRARARQLKPDEVKGGTFTLTNHGVSGSLFASPIINQPQCAIMGVGAIQKRVIVVSDGGSDLIAIRPMAYISLTFDHRILDGAMADNFLSKVVEYLQNWD